MTFSHSFSVYIFIYLIIPALFLYRYKLVYSHENYLSKNNTENLRGIAISVIIIHHLVSATSKPDLLTPFIGIGYLGVSIFFFLSGYGITSSYLNKANYLDGFFGKRMAKIFIPFIVLNLIHLSINWMAFGLKYSLLDSIFYISGINLINGSMWYINAIFFWYICFYVLFRYFEKHTEIMFIVTALIYFFGCKQLNLGKYWFDTSFIFPIGVLFCLRKDYIMTILQKYYYHIILVSTFFFVIFFKINQGKTSLAAISARSTAAIMFVVLICLFLYKVDISGNKLLAFMGSISYELYLIHARIIQLNIVSVNNGISFDKIVFYFMLSIVSALLMNRCTLIMHSAFNKFLRKKNKFIETNDTFKI